MNAWPRCRTCMAIHAPDWAGCVASAGLAVAVGIDRAYVVQHEVPQNPGPTPEAHSEELSQPVHEPVEMPKKPGRTKLHANGNKDRCAAYRERHSEAYKAANAERMRQKRSTARADQQQGDAP